MKRADRQAVNRLKGARRALAAHEKDAKRRGDREETPLFLSLNSEVDKAMKDVPWWRR